MSFQRKQENIVGTCQGIFDVVYECDFKSNDGHRMFHVKCSECGWETNMQMHQIKYTMFCRHTDLAGNYITPYEWNDKRIGNIFGGMKRRCYNPKERAYRWYGAKGIKICDEWLNNPLSFEDWALSHGYQNDLTIDRIEENKDYSPMNCRWVTNKDNAKFKSTTRIIEVDGEQHTGREWANVLQLGTNTINTMLRFYPEETVKHFIKERKKDFTKHRKSHQTWLDVYGIEI